MLVCCLAQTTTNICTIHPNNDKIQDYSDCTKYILCAKAIPTLQDCEPGTQFHPRLLECTHQPVDCFKCPSDVFFIDVPVNYACSQFVRCINGIATHHTCESGLLFDPIRRQCNFRADVGCPCPAIDIRGFPLYVRDWIDCSK